MLKFQAVLNSAYRICRVIVLCAAGLYAGLFAVSASGDLGGISQTASFAASTLAADVHDMGKALLRHTGVSDFRQSPRPLRYILLCSPNGSDNKTQAEQQALIIGEVTEHRGHVYREVRYRMDIGQNQIVILIRPGGSETLTIFSSPDHKHLSCLIDKNHPATESGRIPASVIFRPDEEIKFSSKR